MVARFSSVGGSSPRMRGTLSYRNCLRLGYGIIPAYAGEHGDFARYASHANESQADSSGTASRGSSPRMRGTLHLSIDFRHVAGIIPAYAGNTVLLSMPR